ncbi:cytochrome p450 [Colletotrichum incanum]|nr:cytochrome p450 [Colletotrichum incanum]
MSSVLRELQMKCVLSTFISSAVELTANYTHVDSNAPALPHIVKTMLTPALVRLNPVISHEVVEAMTLELPQTGDWEEVDITTKLLRIVAMVSGRIFVGPELCRNEKHLEAAINYTVYVMIAVYIVGLVPLWLRPVLAPRLPYVKKVAKRVEETDEFLRPLVKKRKEASRDPDAETPEDILQWIINSQGDADDKDIANLQLNVSMAAIRTTTLTTVNAVYTLAAMPHLVPELQDDVRQAVAGCAGEFGSSALQNMKKLESFLKETMRCYPLDAASFQHKVLKPFVLSNGQVIPAGVIVEVPAGSIVADRSVFENVDVFDHLRFYNLRQYKGNQKSGTKAAEVVANSQFISVSESSLTFGYGRHACPGRFFAANEIKMIMANILLHCEVKNPEGVIERHKNIRTGSRMNPDHTKKIMLRKLR